MTDHPHLTPSQSAELLVQALPHMQRYDQEVIVIKYGGNAMGDAATAEDFAEDIVLLEQSGLKPVVCHGGGPQIAAMLKKLGIQSEFKQGLRVTDEATVEVVEMVLAGSVNKEIVGYITREGGRAIGLCGKDGNMVTARKVTRTIVDPDSKIEEVLDLGFVGEPDKVNTDVLDAVLKAEWSVLDQPSRLQVLVERYSDYLDLKPLDVRQLARLDDIPGRGPVPVGNGKTPGKPLDLLTASAASGVDPVRTGSVATTPKLPKPASSKTVAAKSTDAAKVEIGLAASRQQSEPP